MTEISLTRGYVALIDDKDLHLVEGWKWHATVGRCGKVYAVRTEYNGGRFTRVWMHKVILVVEDGLEVDHKDGNTLDNRRTNLRAATLSQNRANRSPTKKNQSGYKGVYWKSDRNNWRAQIQFNKQLTHLGSFDNAEDAARAYDEAARKYHGEFAYLNFQ